MWALLAALLALWPAAPATADEAAWLQALREGRAVALLRHADAPGVGDPAGMRLDDCTTQRNLGPAGRRQAAAIGARLRAAGIAGAQLLTSPWCRARDTAALLGLGPVSDEPALASLFGRPENRERQLAALRARIAALPMLPPAILVSHQVNITALTGIYPASGELVVLDRAGLQVLGRIATPVP